MYQTKVGMSTGGSINARANCGQILSRGTDLSVFRGSTTGLAGFGCWLDLGHMPHLAAGPGCTLAVEVDGGARNRQPSLIAVDVVPDQVGHGDMPIAEGLAQRPSGDGADVLFELRDRGAVQRPVPGIVHPRSNLVDQDLWSTVPLHHKHLDREHADIIERMSDPPRDGYRLRRQRV